MLVLFASRVGVVAFFVFVLLFFSHKYNALLLLFYCSSCVVLLLFPHGVTTFPAWCCYYFQVSVVGSSCVATIAFSCTSIPHFSHVGVVNLLALVLHDLFTLVSSFFLHWCCFSSHMLKCLLAKPLLFLLDWCYSFFPS